MAFVADGGLADTVAARATAPGASARAVVRVSGPEAVEVAAAVFRPGGAAGGPLERARALGARTPLRAVAGAVELDDARIPALAVRFAAPRSYTGEDLVELHLPGSPALVERVLVEMARAGARPARPGELTRRAFLSGRLDLAEAEAVLALTQASSDADARAAARALRSGIGTEVERVRAALLEVLADVEVAIDFSHEDIEAELLARAGTDAALAAAAAEVDRLLALEGGRGAGDRAPVVVLYGPPNAGKSSLLNALAGEEKALVAPLAGTTRDAVGVEVVVRGGGVLLVDVAGVAGEEGAEGAGLAAEAARRAQEAMRGADLVLVLVDGSEPLSEAGRRALLETEGRPRVVVRSKEDLPARLEAGAEGGAGQARREGRGPMAGGGDAGEAAVVAAALAGAVPVSARTGAGLDALRAAIAARLAREIPPEGAGVGPNARHRACLERARERLGAALGAAARGTPPDLAAIDIRAALDALGEITGASAAEDLLDRIFARFCIGK